MNTIPFPIPTNHDQLAEQIYEYVCANTPAAGSKGQLSYPWPHSAFATLSESAKNHYRICAFFVQQSHNMKLLDRINRVMNTPAFEASLLKGGVDLIEFQSTWLTRSGGDFGQLPPTYRAAILDGERELQQTGVVTLA
jgi:hypothetical protein